MNLQDVSTFLHAIHDDVKRCVEELNAKSDPAFWSRAYVRALASLIEGSIFIYKTAVVTFWKEGRMPLTTEQQLFFMNLDWRLTADGEIEMFEKRLQSKASLKGFVVQLAKVVLGEKPSLNDAGWAGLVRFYEVRDALVHPKDLVGLAPGRETVLEIEAGRIWLMALFRRVNDSMLALAPKNG